MLWIPFLDSNIRIGSYTILILNSKSQYIIEVVLFFIFSFLLFVFGIRSNVALILNYVDQADLELPEIHIPLPQHWD